MSEPDEISGTVQAVRIGQNHEPAEITIFYTPHKGFKVHNGYLAENERKRSNGRAYRRLTIVTPEGDIIQVRRYNDNGEFRCDSPGYWLVSRQAIV